MKLSFKQENCKNSGPKYEIPIINSSIKNELI
jgi:hypothetical protein